MTKCVSQEYPKCTPNTLTFTSKILGLKLCASELNSKHFEKCQLSHAGKNHDGFCVSLPFWS